MAHVLAPLMQGGPVGGMDVTLTLGRLKERYAGAVIWFGKATARYRVVVEGELPEATTLRALDMLLWERLPAVVRDPASGWSMGGPPPEYREPKQLRHRIGSWLAPW